MSGDPALLADREKEVLRLVLAGHDAKSIARERGLSVHVVNERLRDSRRKLGVGSSREAARRLAALEGPNSLGNKDLGVAAPAPAAPAMRAPQLAGAIAMIVAAAALGALVHAAAGGGADAAPSVVRTSPASGAVVPAGAATISVTFDRPMRRDSYSFVSSDAGGYPPCARKPAVSRDGQTFSLRCRLEPGRSYAVGFNDARYRNFVSVRGGVPASPYRLTFSTRR